MWGQLAHAEVVDDEQVRAGQLGKVVLAGVGERRLGEFFEEGVRFAVEDAVALLDGGADATAQMHGAAAVLIVAKRLERQRAERRTFLGKHGGDLALGRAVNAGVGPAPLPAVQTRLAVVEVLEAEAA